MTKINKFIVAIIVIILLCIAVTFYNALKHYKMQQVTYDLPEEFNPHTVSRDRSDATPMMVVYDTLTNTYIFEFMDK
jgi:cell division protein FtsL